MSLASVAVPSGTPSSPLQRPRRFSCVAGNDSGCSFAAAVFQPSCTNNSNENCDSNSHLSSENSVKELGPTISRVPSKGSNPSCLRRPGCPSRVGDVHGTVDLQRRTILSESDGEEAAAESRAGFCSPNEWQDLAWRKRRRRATHIKNRARGLYAVNAAEEGEEEDLPVPPTPSAVAAADAISRLDSGICGALGSLDLRWGG